MRLFKKLRLKLDYLSTEQVDQIHSAYLTAHAAHRGQRRQTGEAYITHPVAVACILADLKMDYQTLMAALLHDVIEDTAVDKAALAARFGDDVAELVDGVSKLTQIEFFSKAEAQAENFRKMVLAMSRDIRVIIIKLADRLHNLRTIYSLPPTKRRRIGIETLEIFSPIAKRLGMRTLSVELEELAFQAAYPMRYAVIKQAVERSSGNRKRIMALIEKALHESLQNANFPTCVIEGRRKHVYSIYRKMKKKHMPFNEIMDVYAFRIVTDKVDTCYRVLGLIHGLFKPVPERFKDYIAIPKANGYQSLHTTLFGPYGLPIEIQIRTTDMDKTANNGIAAHWLYKTGEEQIDMRQLVPTQLRAERLVNNLMELQQRTSNSLEFIENVKVDLFPDEIYVFTPKGKIMELPLGATAVDFAYAVHTDIGNSCVAVKVDRQLAPLSSVLTTGQTVEIITSLSARPSPTWLNFVVTGKARSGIRHFVKTRRRDESIALGKQLLKKSMNHFSSNVKKIPSAAFEYFLKETQLETLDDLYEEIGSGNRAATLVAQRLIHIAEDKHTLLDTLPQAPEAGSLMIKGTEGMAIDYATCCYPIPGDPIVGVLTVGRGVMVHVEHCRHVSKLRRNPEHCMALSWDEHASGDFKVMVKLEVENQRGVLANVALAISDAEANIEDIQVEERDGQYYAVTVKITVKNRDHLAKVMRQLRHLKTVQDFIRVYL